MKYNGGRIALFIKPLKNINMAFKLDKCIDPNKKRYIIDTKVACYGPIVNAFGHYYGPSF